jgi:hypothetical protein
MAVPLEGAEACLQGTQHRCRDVRVVTFLKRARNDLALAGDAVLAIVNEPLDLGQRLAVRHRQRSMANNKNPKQKQPGEKGPDRSARRGRLFLRIADVLLFLSFLAP